jgi:hypothetical protein
VVGRVELERLREPVGDETRPQPALEREAGREVGRQREGREDVDEPGAFGGHAPPIIAPAAPDVNGWGV